MYITGGAGINCRLCPQMYWFFLEQGGRSGLGWLGFDLPSQE